MTAEQAPNPASRITLGRRVDRFGVPVARLEWRLTPLDEHSIRRTQDILDAQFQAAGLGQIELKWGETHPDPRIHGCWHHIGTTRMSSDPRTGVVDGGCFLHGLSNLSFAGSSVMPTAGAVTVTLSITALALRLAGELGRRLG
jgi:choline dehydrogenase-like flavoprotein